MDSDAYSAYVTMDVDLMAPLFRIGLLGGTQYADMEDAPGGRRHRHSLEVVKRAVQYFRSGGPVAFVVHLGDVLAMENAVAGTQWAALESFDAERSKAGTTPWHFAFGPHDVHCFGLAGLGAALKPARAPTSGSRQYYAFFPAAQWRVLVLDCLDPEAGSADGGIGNGQLQWLSCQLSVADSAGERVIMLSHRGVVGGYELPNAAAVRERIANKPGVVAAFIFLGNGDGWYECDSAGVRREDRAFDTHDAVHSARVASLASGIPWRPSRPTLSLQSPLSSPASHSHRYRCRCRRCRYRCRYRSVVAPLGTLSAHVTHILAARSPPFWPRPCRADATARRCTTSRRSRRSGAMSMRTPLECSQCTTPLSSLRWLVRLPRPPPPLAAWAPGRWSRWRCPRVGGSSAALPTPPSWPASCM